MKQILAPILFTLASASIHAAILTVDNNPGSVAMYKTFEAAYQAAEDGDTILVAGSKTGYGSRATPEHSIHKRLTIIGAGYHLSENAAPGASNLNNASTNISLLFYNDPDIGSSNGSRVIGIDGVISVENASNIYAEKCRGSISTQSQGRVTINQCFVDTSYLQGAGSTITNSIVTRGLMLNAGTSANHCVISGSCHLRSLSQVSNSIFTNEATGPELLTDFSNCISLSINPATIGNPVILPSGSGNINAQLEMSDIFLWNNSPDGKYQLKPNSVAIAAGSGGADVGAFGGPRPYKLSGIPAVPRLTHLSVPTSATSTSGLRFEIEAQAFGN